MKGLTVTDTVYPLDVGMWSVFSSSIGSPGTVMQMVSIIPSECYTPRSGDGGPFKDGITSISGMTRWYAVTPYSLCPTVISGLSPVWDT